MKTDNRHDNVWMHRARCALLVVVGVLVYANSLSGPFIFDDMEAIETNEHLRTLWPPSQTLSAPPQASVAGRPVVSLTLALNYAAGELDVGGYHAVNIAIHILAALVLFGVVRRTLLAPALRSRFARAGGWIAFLCALLWLVHPLQTEAVNYTTQRTESLMGLFYLLTLYGAIRTIEARPEPGRHRWIAASILCCALGMASKESMVTAPLMVLLYDATFGAGSIKRALRERASLYAGLAATWIVLVALNLTGPRSETVGLALGVSAWDYLLNQCLVVVRYLRLAVWPHPLTIDYGYPQPQQFGDVAAFAVTIVALLGATLVALVRRPMIGFLGAWFFVILAPTSSFIPIVSEVGAERRMYLPLAGVVVLAVLLGVTLIERLGAARRGRADDRAGAQAGGFAPRVGAVVAIAAAVLLAGATVRRNRDYRSEASIWRSAVEVVPDNHRAHYSLGEAMQSEGRVDAARESYRSAIRIKPDYARAHHNLATILRSQGQPEEAIRHYRLAAESRPDYAITHFNLGNLLQSEGRPAEAIASYRAAVETEPDFIEAHNNLGILLQQQGRVDEALEHYRETLRINPDYEKAYYNIGGVLQARGQLMEAIEAYRRAVAIKPDYARAHYMLALSLRAIGEMDEAVRHMRLFEQYESEGSQGP